MELKGRMLNVYTREIYLARMDIENGVITAVERIPEEIHEDPGDSDGYLLPGFIDSHIHIESSMLCPSRFAEAAVPHGTTAVVTDPHEIANVAGTTGINYMRKDARSVPMRVFFTAPSCVPATSFETAGAELNARKIHSLLSREDFVALGEVMNFPAVVEGQKGIMKKIEVARKLGKRIDGHAPQLSGAPLCRYVAAGIDTDHECCTLDEAVEKARLGMKIQIREGGASRNMEALAPVARKAECFLVSDDRRPGDLMEGHVDALLRKAVSLGIDPTEAVRMVTINPARHYNLGCGAIAPGHKADIVEVEDLSSFRVKRVFIAGRLVAENGRALFAPEPLEMDSTFRVRKIRPDDFKIPYTANEGIADGAMPERSESSKRPDPGEGTARVRVIEIIEGQLLTKAGEAKLTVKNGEILPDPDSDVLKIAVVERYGGNGIQKAFVRGFGLKSGGIASSVAHDSHNIIAVGVDDKSLIRAVNEVVDEGGGLVAVGEVGGEEGAGSPEPDVTRLDLPVGGLMSTRHVSEVVAAHKLVERHAHRLGSALEAPFMTLSFLALPVIPELKLSDRGLFDVKKFEFVDVVIE